MILVHIHIVFDKEQIKKLMVPKFTNEMLLLILIHNEHSYVIILSLKTHTVSLKLVNLELKLTINIHLWSAIYFNLHYGSNKGVSME